jgi:hypothetical protein
MPTPRANRLRAEVCVRLANETTELYAKEALLELAAEFRTRAEQLECRDAEAANRGARQLTGVARDTPSRQRRTAALGCSDRPLRAR